MKMTDAAREWYYNTKFPHTDDDGVVWLDPQGFDNVLGRDNWGPGPCFICKKETSRVDVNYMTFFCNSAECNAKIIDELNKSNLKWPPDPDDGFPRWEGEGGSVS